MLKWVFGADTGPFKQSLGAMRKDIQAFSSTAKGHIAGLFGIGAITAWISSTIEAAGRIQDLSDRLNISAESFQKIAYAAMLAGGDVETVARSLTAMTRNLSEASDDADKFAGAAATLGINLKTLKALAPEDQMIELARGYEQSADKSAALTALMKLLGKAGADIIPMLAQGPKALAEQMRDASIATNEQVAAMAKIGDAMDKLKANSLPILGDMIDLLMKAKAGWEYLLDRAAAGKDVADANFIKAIGEIEDGPPKKKGKEDIEAVAKSAAKQAELAKQAEEERKKFAEEIAKLEEDARIRALDLSEKILDAEERRAKLAADAAFGADENKALEARKEQLEVEKEIAGYREEKDREDKKSKDDIDKKKKDYADDLAALKEKGKEISRNNKFESLDDKGKLAMLEEERKKALEDAKTAAANGDEIGAQDKRNQAGELTSQIDDTKRGIADKAKSDLDALMSRGPTIATSSLAAVAGGGGARLMEKDYGQKTVSLLEIIAQNTAGGSEGAKPPEPIT